ncbi:Uncharacterised protein [Mycobacteroides abscessus subsp. abscessus]|nr:Uncharacterised protein [Mycobacteroides abscessus subsp. abscessus]
MLPSLARLLSTAMLAIFSARDGTMPCQPNRPSEVMAGITCTRRGRNAYSVRSPGMRQP